MNMSALCSLIFWCCSLGAAPLAHAAFYPAASQSLDNAPAALVAAIAKTQAKDAGSNPTDAIGTNGCAELIYGSQGEPFRGCFGTEGATFRTHGKSVSLRLVAWGHSGKLQPVTLSRARASANHVQYQGQGLTLWWRVLPIGFEQGFILRHDPQGTGPIELQLATNRAPMIERNTLIWGNLRYGKPAVMDAAGRSLPVTLSMRGKIVTLAFNAAHARYPITIDPLVWIQHELTASDGSWDDALGFAVALSADGSTALVGADGKTVGNNALQGAAYVYMSKDGAWHEAAELTAADGAAGDEFGNSVALSADGATALIGAASKTVAGNNQQGAVYIYTRPARTWTSTSHYAAELTAADGAAGDEFGTAVALSANGATALVGASDKTVNANILQGAAYVFTRPATGWSSSSHYTAELRTADGATGDQFGSAVALSADGATALVGADNKTIGTTNLQGAAYMFTRPSQGWTSTSRYTAELTAADGAMGDQFGTAVALGADGRTALVGADGKTVSDNTLQGAVYIFTRPGGGWTTTDRFAAELTAENGASGDQFGNSVALAADGAVALVGAFGKSAGPDADNSQQGAAYMYLRPPSGWTSTSRYAVELTANNGAAGDFFGNAVALSKNGREALVGAQGKTVVGNGFQGAAYVYASNDSAALAPTKSNARRRAASRSTSHRAGSGQTAPGAEYTSR